MGWKASIITINSEEELDKVEIFESLGYYELKEVDKQCFESIMNPDDDRIYMGKYNGNTIICMQDVPLDSMKKSLSKAETILSEKFHNTEIISFALQSVVNLWGYSLVKNGKKIRVRAGSSEGGTFIEEGDILEEEKELFSQSHLNTEGERVFIFDGVPDDKFSDDQVGENFVFDISCKYFGESLDCCDELLETKFNGYSFSKVKPQIKLPIETQIEIPEELQSQPQTLLQPEKVLMKEKVIKKPWWKFW